MQLWSAVIFGFLVVVENWCRISASTSNGPLEPVKQWNLLPYNFEWDAPVNDPNYYNPENVVATGIAIGYDRIFLGTPRLFSGVPATLSVMSRNPQGDSPVLQAYPNWAFHTVSRGTYNCSDLGLVSVYRLRIDSCNRLWALDSGVSRSLEDYEITCPPKILVFDLATDQVVRRIDFPREVRRGETLFTNLVIDETTSRPENNCDDVFVYITDTVEPAIVVYDSGRDLTWRLTHPSMFPDPDFSQSEILGHRFILMDGVVGLAFDARNGIVYFQPLATDRLFSITTQTLRAGPIPANQELPVRLVGKKSSQGLGLAVDPVEGCVFFSPFSDTAVASYNPATNQQRTLAYDQENLQFAADLTTSVYDQGALYILTSKFHRFFLKNVDRNEVNTRILKINLDGPGQQSQYAFPYMTRGSSRRVPTFPQFSQRQPLRSSAISNQYLNVIQQPFQFEPVGLANRRDRTSAFNPLNTGEQLPRTPDVSLTGNSFYPKVRPNYGDFNGIRFAKSVSFNTTVIH